MVLLIIIYRPFALHANKSIQLNKSTAIDEPNVGKSRTHQFTNLNVSTQQGKMLNNSSVILAMLWKPMDIPFPIVESNYQSSLFYLIDKCKILHIRHNH